MIMPVQETELLHHSLTARLLQQSTLLAGSTIQCIVELQNVPATQPNLDWPITGLVGWVIGQFKLDQSVLLKQSLTSPNGLTFDQMETQEVNDLWFDSKSLFTSALGSDAHVFYCGPMEVHSEFLPTENGVTIRLSAPLPAHLPPSVRGRLFKVAYKILIGVQLNPKNESPTTAALPPKTHALQLPFRLLPSPSMYHSLREPDWSELDNDENNTGLMEKREQWVSSGLTSNPFWSDDTSSTCANSLDWSELNVDHTEHDDSISGNNRSKHPVVNAGQLRSALFWATRGRTADMVKRPESNGASQRSLLDPFSSTDRSDLGSERSTLGFSRPSSGTQPATFIISCAQGLVGRLCLLRTLFRMEDLVRGYFDFTEARVPCLSCHVSLQYEERCIDATTAVTAVTDPDNELMFGSSGALLFTSLPLNEKGEPKKFLLKMDPDHARISSCAEIQLACLSKHILPFTLPIPSNVTPQFCVHNSTLIVDCRWRLRFEFILAPETSWETLVGKPTTEGRSDLSDKARWNLPSYVKTEKLAWNMPIQLVCSDPSVICNPLPDYAQAAVPLTVR